MAKHDDDFTDLGRTKGALGSDGSQVNEPTRSTNDSGDDSTEMSSNALEQKASNVRGWF